MKIACWAVALLAGWPLVGQTLVNGGRVISGAWDASGSASSKPAPQGSGAPAAGGCAASGDKGKEYTDTSATAGSSAKYVCVYTGSAYAWQSVSGGGGGGNLTAAYLVKTTDATLPNAQAMGALATGIVKNTTTTGVQSIAARADVLALWTACSGYLKSDGTCDTPSSGGPFIKDYTAAKCQAGVAGAGFNLPAAGAPTAACITGTDTPASVGGVLQFTDDGTTVISVQDWFVLPASVATVSLSGTWRSAAANAGLNVVWQIRTKCAGDGETFDGGAWNAAQTITDANKATANQSNDFALTPVTITGCAAGERLKFYFFRDPAHASDTLAATAELISLRFTVQ